MVFGSGPSAADLHDRSRPCPCRGTRIATLDQEPSMPSHAAHSSAAQPPTGQSRGVVNLKEKLGLLPEQWAPRVVAELNDYQFKVVRIEGDFIWHDHPETDEAFLVLEGELRIDFRNGHVTLKPGELFVVPKGVEHKPFAEQEVKMLLIEPRGTFNTGHEGGDRTAQNDVWI
jgi:mannose-6-phosphate isomerase-like protein (cupin superfamily)